MSDGLTARNEQPWQFVKLDATDKTQQKVYKTGKKIQAKDETGALIVDENNQPIIIDEEKILLQRASMWTIIRKRKYVGLTKLHPQNGESLSAFDLATGPETSLSFRSIGRIGAQKKFLCVSDNPGTTNHVLGVGEQVQVWVYMSQWENIPEGVFK